MVAASLPSSGIASVRLPVSVPVLRRLSAAVCVLIVAVGGLGGAASAETTPTVTLTPPSGFHDQQVITVRVGPNTLFPPGRSIKILECAIGATSDAQCDGNTINNDSVLTAPDGSFTYARYQLFVLPSSLLDEPAGGKPVCDATHECELYVGLNQTDLTQPKVFSAPFTIGAGTAATTTTTSTTKAPVGGVLSKTGTDARRSLAIALGFIGVGLVLLAAAVPGGRAARPRTREFYRRASIRSMIQWLT